MPHSFSNGSRASFLHSGNAAYKAFFAAVVEPSLKVNVRSIPQNLEDIAGRFCAIIQGGEASEEDQVKLKLACMAINQGFTGQLICGLMLQCNRMLHRQSRDIWTMAGRREICTDLEHSLIADAGQQLAMASGNRELARQFGMSSTCCRISLDEARSFSLPVPALALQWPEVLRENWEILDHRFVRPQEAPKRASDCLGVVFRPVSLQNGPTMVNKGHSWRVLFQEPSSPQDFHQPGSLQNDVGTLLLQIDGAQGSKMLQRIPKATGPQKGDHYPINHIKNVSKNIIFQGQIIPDKLLFVKVFKS